MAELERSKLKAERATYAKRPLKYRGAQAVSSPVPDYEETPADTYYRLVLADTSYGSRATINQAERLLAKKKDPTNKRHFDPIFLGRDGADAQAAKFRLWRTMFPPPEMVGRQLDCPPCEPIATESPEPSTAESCDLFTSEPSPATPSDSLDSIDPPEVPLPAWAELFTRESLSKDAAWAITNKHNVKTGAVKRNTAPSAMAWEFALMLTDPEREKTFWAIIFKNAEKFDAQIAEERRKEQIEAERKLQLRIDDGREIHSVFKRLAAKGYGREQPVPVCTEASGGESGVSGASAL